jgi:hypothetical protein
MRTTLILAIAALGAIWFFRHDLEYWLANRSAQSATAEYASPPPLAAQIDLEITGTRTDRANIVTLDLQAHNRNGRWVDAYVACHFFDAQGVSIGDTAAIINAIEPHGSKRGVARWAGRSQRAERSECSVSSAYEAR